MSRLDPRLSDRWRPAVAVVALLLVSIGAARPAAAAGGDHPHHVALVADATSQQSSWTPHFTVGAEYEYRLPVLNGLLGVFAGGEVIIAHGTPLVFTTGLAVHPVGGLKILAGVGTELHAAHPDPHFLVRGGVGYDFHIGVFSVGPAFLVDYVNGHVALVYGLGAGVAI